MIFWIIRGNVCTVIGGGIYWSMCCVMPDELQPLAIEQFGRVLKAGGQFRLWEMVYSKDECIHRRQERFAPFVEKIYGALRRACTRLPERKQ